MNENETNEAPHLAPAIEAPGVTATQGGAQTHAAPRYVPAALYTFGCCHYGHKEPYRTAVVASDSLSDAWRKARLEIQIGLTEHLCHVETKPNPAFMQEQARWRKEMEPQHEATAQSSGMTAPPSERFSQAAPTALTASHEQSAPRAAVRRRP